MLVRISIFAGMFVTLLLVLFMWNMMKMNLLGYAYRIYNSSYNAEMINKQCNAVDPVETPGGLHRGSPSMLINVNTIKKMCM